MVRQIQLTENNSRKVDELSRLTGKTPDEIVNAIIEAWDTSGELDESGQQARWNAAIFQNEK